MLACLQTFEVARTTGPLNQLMTNFQSRLAAQLKQNHSSLGSTTRAGSQL